MSEGNHFTVYLPNLTSEQLFSISDQQVYPEISSQHLLKSDWQLHFCENLGLAITELPWSYLRAEQFDLDEQVQTAICCDPVMMQMTHRGAYLWGQQGLKFSKEEVIQIVAQINSQLMREGENLYMLDNSRWLYTNKKKLSLKQRSFEDYIGKDMFGFAYQGSDGLFFDKLAVEIQMLIKQMVDYQGLQGLEPEMLVNVHFSSQSHYQTTFQSIAKTRSQSNLMLLTDDPLMQSFCAELSINHQPTREYKNLSKDLSQSKSSQAWVFYLTDERLQNQLAMINNCFDALSSKEANSVTLVTQDKSLTYRAKGSLLNKILSWMKK